MEHKNLSSTQLIDFPSTSLNPLFIRSRFGTNEAVDTTSDIFIVSIPYSSGLGLERRAQKNNLDTQSMSLNPLFIRSRFGTMKRFRVLLMAMTMVSIPYSSGLGLER